MKGVKAVTVVCTSLPGSTAETQKLRISAADIALFGPHRIQDAEPECLGVIAANQLASHLGIEAKTIRNWTSEGTIPHKKIGGSPRYLKSDIDEALKNATLGRKKSSRAKQSKPKKS